VIIIISHYFIFIEITLIQYIVFSNYLKGLPSVYTVGAPRCSNGWQWLPTCNYFVHHHWDFFFL